MGIEAMGILSEATFWRALAAAGIFLVGLVYVRGWRRLQSFHQGPPPKDAPASARSLMLFVPGLTLLAVAFVSPLGYLATQYFSARIIQHMLLVASIPSLLMLSNPCLLYTSCDRRVRVTVPMKHSTGSSTSAKPRMIRSSPESVVTDVYKRQGLEEVLA